MNLRICIRIRDKVSRWVQFQLELRNDCRGRIVEKVAINNKLIRCFSVYQCTLYTYRALSTMFVILLLII